MSERRQSGRARRRFYRDGEADAREAGLLGGAEDGGDDADDFPGGVDERAARAARIRRGVELDEVGERPLALGRAVLALEAGDHAMRDRRANAEGKADRRDMLALEEMPRRAQRRGPESVRNAIRLQHREIVLWLARP